MESPARLKARLERLCADYGPERMGSDPVRFPRRYAREEDREVAGFIASALAYGRQAHIGRSVEQVLARLGERPAEELRGVDPARARRELRGFSHRFNTGGDIACLFVILGRILDEHGSLNAAFLRGFDPASPDTGEGLDAFCRLALATDVGALAPKGRIPERAGVRFFFPSPRSGSACKRLNMFLRWMVRSGGVDLGLWHGVPASRLVMPLDTHVARVSRELGLSRRSSADWKMALEVTASLRRFDPDDPVRFDFALFSWGLSRAAGAA